MNPSPWFDALSESLRIWNNRMTLGHTFSRIPIITPKHEAGGIVSLGKVIRRPRFPRDLGAALLTFGL